MDVRDMKQRRGDLHEQATAIVNTARLANRGLTHDEQSKFDALMSETESLRAQLDREGRLKSLDVELRTSAGRQTETETTIVDSMANDKTRLAFRAWALGNRARPEHIEAAEGIGLRYNAQELETRALSSVTATQGQASIPDEVMMAFWDAQKWYGRVRSVSTVLATSTGAPLPIPTTDDTANTGEIVADSGAVTTTVDPLFGQVLLKPFKYSSKAVIVPVELLMDSAINLPVYLGTKLGERIARKQNTDFTVGAGTTLPFGVQVQSALGKTAAATNAITFDEIIDLYHSVDVAYRNRPKFRFMMHDTTASYVRKLKDSQNRYLWEMSLQAGQPDRILGVPVVINNDMDSAFTSNKRLILCGDFAAYHIQDAGAVTLIRADELRVLNHQSVFLAFWRSDGNLAEANAVRYLRTA